MALIIVAMGKGKVGKQQREEKKDGKKEHHFQVASIPAGTTCAEQRSACAAGEQPTAPASLLPYLRPLFSHHHYKSDQKASPFWNTFISWVMLDQLGRKRKS